MIKELHKVLLAVFLITISLSTTLRACEGKTGKAVGDCSPNFTVKTIDGKPFELEKLRGKVVLVNFWATWCKPCVVEMPSMQKAYSLINNKDFEILAISIDSNSKDINEFLDNKIQDHLKFPIFFDDAKKISSMFGTFQVPETYIIDKTGKIRDKVIGMRDWDDSVTVNYLKKLLQE